MRSCPTYRGSRGNSTLAAFHDDKRPVAVFGAVMASMPPITLPGLSLNGLPTMVALRAIGACVWRFAKASDATELTAVYARPGAYPAGVRLLPHALAYQHQAHSLARAAFRSTSLPPHGTNSECRL